MGGIPVEEGLSWRKQAAWFSTEWVDLDFAQERRPSSGSTPRRRQKGGVQRANPCGVLVISKGQRSCNPHRHLRRLDMPCRDKIDDTLKVRAAGQKPGVLVWPVGSRGRQGSITSCSRTDLRWPNLQSVKSTRRGASNPGVVSCATPASGQPASPSLGLLLMPQTRRRPPLPGIPGPATRLTSLPLSVT